MSIVKENFKITNNSNIDLSQLENIVARFYPYVKEKLNFNKDVDISLISDPENAKDPWGKTAYYDPSKMKIVIFVDNRHPKDMLRSLSHELVHHAQNCRGEFDKAQALEPGYAQKDPHMRRMEGEAYLLGNGFLVRDFEDYIKSQRNQNLTENKKMKGLTNEQLKTVLENTIKRVMEEGFYYGPNDYSRESGGGYTSARSQARGRKTVSGYPGGSSKASGPTPPDQVGLEVQKCKDRGMGASVRDGRIICVPKEGLDEDAVEESNCGPGNRDEDAVEESNCGPGNRDRDEDLNEKKESECDRFKARLKSAESEGDKKAVLKIGLEMADSNCPGSELPVEEKLENPDKADLDDDGKISPYEKKRGEAIEKSMKSQKDKSLKEGYETKMSCEMKGGKWHEKEGVCSFGDEHQRPGQLREHFTRKKNDMLFERLVEKWTK